MFVESLVGNICNRYDLVIGTPGPALLNILLFTAVEVHGIEHVTFNYQDTFSCSMVLD